MTIEEINKTKPIKVSLIQSNKKVIITTLEEIEKISHSKKYVPPSNKKLNPPTSLKPLKANSINPI